MPKEEATPKTSATETDAEETVCTAGFLSVLSSLF